MTVLKALRAVAETLGVSSARVALAWLLTRPYVTSVIIGAKTHNQLDDNLAASDLRLAPEHVGRGGCGETHAAPASWILAAVARSK